MQIILLETLNKLGKAGEIVSVKDGYARNHLIPQKKDIIANKKNKQDLKEKMSYITENNEKKIKEAEIIKSKIDNQELSILMEANEDGNLYGNINQKTLIEKIKSELSAELSADNLVFNQIKTIGSHQITVRLYDNIEASINIIINKKN